MEGEREREREREKGGLQVGTQTCMTFYNSYAIVL